MLRKLKIMVRFMSQVTNETFIAESLHLQSWAEMIRKCNVRPVGMEMDDWCKQYGITKHCYYYRYGRVRSLYLKQNLNQTKAGESDFALIATGNDSRMANSSTGISEENALKPRLTIQVNNALISIDEDTPVNLLSKVTGS